MHTLRRAPWTRRLSPGLAALLAALAAGGCKRASEAPQEVVVYTSVDQVFSEPVFRAFEQRTGLHVRAVFDTEETKSTGVLNRLVAEGASPGADVFWSGDPVRPFLLVHRGLVAPYVSPRAAGVPAAFKDARGLWTGSGARVRVLLVNTQRVKPADVPRSLEALTDARWKGQAAIANPLFGTTTMHVAALFSVWGEERARAFLEGLKRNEVRLASSNGEVKRLVASGEVAFGLTDTDDAHEALASGAPVTAVYPDQDGMGTLVMPTSVVLMKGAPHAEAGRRLVDFLVSPDAERMLAESAAHLPLQQGVPVPAGVARVPDVKAMDVDYDAVAGTMERIQPWLRQWVGL
jgi:iron(III) transport system substrate-binding protein